MNTNPLTKGILSENFAGIGTVTPEMVAKRAAELAIINGRPAGDVSTTDYAQAKRELTGESDLDPLDAERDDLPESARADTDPSDSGHIVPELAEEDDDEDGRSISERLVEQGVNEAEHDQMLQAAKSAEKEDKDNRTQR